MSDKNLIGAKIRQLRENREMNQQQLANASENSVELLEHIENGDVVPSLTPLIKIAKALDVRIGTFMDDVQQRGPVIVEQGQTEKVIYFSGQKDQTKESAMEFYSLASGKCDRHMEPFLIDVDIHDDAEFKLESHEGEEFIYVIEGEIEIVYGSEKYTVSKGDTIYYDSVVPHHLHAYGEKPAKILAVIYAPF
ncbi:MAG: XRE family transcriptional regulator [Methanobacteriaceae archaeon]|nr:XRE family transcriptional regulator [Methanobacteriaceae archaeon]MDO9626690.1 XRE family transcriptional regulator [Methanobacteriaceae archaeon]